MVISQPLRIILHIIIVLHNAASIALNASRTQHTLYHDYNIKVTHRNGYVTYFLHESDHGGIINDLFFIHFDPMRLLFI